jgi:hypothetical protein
MLFEIKSHLLLRFLHNPEYCKQNTAYFLLFCNTADHNVPACLDTVSVLSLKNFPSVFPVYTGRCEKEVVLSWHNMYSIVVRYAPWTCYRIVCRAVMNETIPDQKLGAQK